MHKHLIAAAFMLGAVIQPAKADIYVATIGPMTGQYASIGEQMAKGARKAVDDINAAGGLLGEKVVLKVVDDVCDPKQATLMAGKMVNEGVSFVAGHFCSSTSIAASDIYEDEGIIMMTPASTNPQLTERDMDFIYRICGRDDQQGRVAAQYIKDNFAGKRLAILHDRTSYGKGLADQMQASLHKLGEKEVIYEAVAPGERDFSALVSLLKNKGVEVIYFGGYHTEAGLIRRQSKDQGLNAAFISGDALVSLEYWSITGAAGAGTLMTFSPDPRLNPAAADVVQYFNDAGYDPEGYTLYTYAALQIFADAVRRAETVDTQAVSDFLKSDTSFETVLGSITFDEKGDVEAPGYVMYEWQDGSYKYADDNAE